MSIHQQKVRPGSRLMERESSSPYGKPQPARVMAIAEGWVMVRFKGAAPILVYMRELHLRFEVTKW
ncbi:hypothetical protein [Ochrobactrum sp. A-1]|uniref:hypothetical protein n=1 Tax=Ochrobactrum sp. A-1 TaxID=2920940 RepID=UPI001F0A8459|nr:hypothetical protein [Ochrobactrum sp. A-1]